MANDVQPTTLIRSLRSVHPISQPLYIQEGSYQLFVYFMAYIRIRTYTEFQKMAAGIRPTDLYRPLDSLLHILLLVLSALLHSL